MKSGNLLNSLLGITSANTGVTKSTAAKARADSTEKFHQTLEQVRPEIAARKPTVRKEAPAVEPANTVRPASKPLARQHVQQDVREKVVRADPQPKTLKDDQRVTAKAETADLSVDDKYANATLEGRSGGEQSAEPQHQTPTAYKLSAEGQNLVAVDDQMNALFAPEESSTPLKGSVIAFEDPSIALEGPSITLEEPMIVLDDLVLGKPTDTDDVNTVPESSVSVLSPLPIQSLEQEDSINENGIDLPLAAENVPVVDPNLMVADKASQLKVEEADLAVDSEESLLFSISSPSSQSIASGVAAGAAVAVQPSTIVAATETHSANAINPDVEVSDTEANLLVAADAETSTAIDGGENPDFLLLNSKAALNKLAESTMVAATQEKAAPAVDAKPAVISATAEVVTRLTEAAQSPAARSFVVQTGVPVTVGSPQWSQAVGDKVLWLAAQNVSAAEIRLDPPELGPMQVKVSVNQDQASVTFSSPHPAVREALDQQLNRLREMFTEQGLNLVNVDVSDKSFTKREQEESAKHHRSGGEEDEDLAPVAVSQTISMRLVDHYA